jgi:hypothetical protein
MLAALAVRMRQIDDAAVLLEKQLEFERERAAVAVFLADADDRAAAGIGVVRLEGCAVFQRAAPMAREPREIGDRGGVRRARFGAGGGERRAAEEENDERREERARRAAA